MKVNHISSRWLGGILAVMPFLLGGFFEWTSCLISILLLILLVRKLRQVKTLCGFFKLLSVGLIVLATGTQRCCWWTSSTAAVPCSCCWC